MFGRKCSIIGVVHVHALPGSGDYKGLMNQVLDKALFDARTYKEEGVDALMIENTHDVPYEKGRVEPETVAAMTLVANAIKQETMLPLGIQILAGANLEALAVAHAVGLDFIRVEGYVYAHVGDEGIHESCAAKLYRKRAQLHAEQIKIFADIKKKHSSHAITDDITLAETAKDAEFFKVDGVIVTGARTGEAPESGEVRAVRKAVSNQVLVGSGVTEHNMLELAAYADAVIVGSSAKHEGLWFNAVESERVKRLVASLKEPSKKMPD